MASSSSGQGGQDVPSWNGDPSSFSTFETACKWYVLTLKDSEKAGAAARIWSRLSGPAKSVVRHLDPDQFHHAQGLQKLLETLRRSSLQTLPIPDTFQKLERWNNMKRRDQENLREFWCVKRRTSRSCRSRSGDPGTFRKARRGFQMKPLRPRRSRTRPRPVMTRRFAELLP